MTKEEALKTWLPIISMSIDNIPELEEAFDMAVKALEQEPVIDKIRADIVKLWQNEPCAIKGGCLDEILEIIDKYKAERIDNEEI